MGLALTAAVLAGPWRRSGRLQRPCTGGRRPRSIGRRPLAASLGALAAGCVVLGAALLGAARAPTAPTPRPPDRRPVRVAARVVRCDVGASWFLVDQLRAPDGRRLDVAGRRLLVLPFDGRTPPPCGTRLDLQGLLRRDAGRLLLEGAVWRSTGSPGVVPVRERVRARLQAALPPAEAGLAVALLLGESSAAPAALREDYRALGLLHLLCVSGMHLWCWAACLRHLLRGRLAVLRLPCLLAVTALAGFAAPVLRALAALAWRAVLTHRGWRVAPLQLWAAALWVEMLLVPARPAGLGFVLSYAATFFLLAATGPVKRNSTRIAVASLAATLGTMPWILRAGGTVQPWAPLLSPLFALLLPVRILCCAAALLPGAEWAAGAVLRITLWPEQALLSLLRGLPGAPWAATTLPFGAALAASLCALWALRAAAGSRLRAALRGSGAAVLLCCLRAPAPAALLALPVGHGLAVVVGSGTQTLLFDLGSADLTPERLVLGRLLPELHRHGWPLPRRVVLSHADDDHGNGVATLAGFGCLALPWIPDGATRVLADCGPWRITLLGLAPELRGAPNAEGQALEVETAGFRAVLLGDAWGHALLDLTRRLRPGPIDLLLLPHHGRTTDGVAELLLHLRPRRAWIACAEDAEPAVLEVMAGLAATGLEVRVERTGPGALELRAPQEEE